MSTPYWNKRNKREKRFPNNYEYKSSSPKNAKKERKLIPKKQDYRIPILKKQIKSEKKKLTKLKKKLKTLE